MRASRIHSIWTASDAAAEVLPASSVTVEEGLGIVGDRYHRGKGTFSRWPRGNRALSFITQEDLNDILEETGIDLQHGRHRRNIVTSGIDLSTLIGREFKIGTTICKGTSTCPPCKIIERRNVPGTFNAMKKRGGIRAEVIQTGEISVNDEIIPIGDITYLP